MMHESGASDLNSVCSKSVAKNVYEMGASMDGEWLAGAG
jgi:hypothetical protein